MSYSEILALSRQTAAGGLNPWFDGRLKAQIDAGLFLGEDQLRKVQDRIIRQLADYRDQAGVGTAVLGMSGGVDSALTAALFKRAGWRVIGFTLPIRQDPVETERGVEACEALGLEHLHLDLSPEYEAMVAALSRVDETLPGSDTNAARTRRGNLRARLRMITLYDQAHRFGGIVASTDNFSELSAGFWTLHGDVGDLAPVQGLIKSWEVPWLARETGVPEKTWRAKPTDGLGIGGGDEAQIGATYLEWDIMIFAIAEALRQNPRVTTGTLADALDLGGDEHARQILDTVLARETGVPEKTWRAKPTDGLGIGGGDEAQIGATYLEWDIMIFAIAEALRQNPRVTTGTLADALDLGGDEHARQILDTVLARLRMTWHKRVNPIRFDHPLADRFALIDRTDESLFRPAVLRQQNISADEPADLEGTSFAPLTLDAHDNKAL